MRYNWANLQLRANLFFCFDLWNKDFSSVDKKCAFYQSVIFTAAAVFQSDYEFWNCILTWAWYYWHFNYYIISWCKIFDSEQNNKFCKVMSLSICEIKHILEAIFLCFDMKDLLLCREVSKRFKTTIDNPTFIIRKFKHYSNFWGIFWKSRLKILPRKYSTQDRTFTVKSLIETAVSIDYFEIEIHSHASI